MSGGTTEEMITELAVDGSNPDLSKRVSKMAPYSSATKARWNLPACISRISCRKGLFSGTNRTVIDGPFAETKELIAGFWLWQVKSMDEAVEWLKRCPNPHASEETSVEIRPVFEAEDFGAEFTPELREQEERLRQQMTSKGSK